MPDNRYNTPAVALHWLLAVALVYELALGWWMTELPKTPPGLRADWFNWHKSVGMALGLLVVLRGLWRLKSGAPLWPLGQPVWQRSLARINHGLLYGCMVVMPVSGFLGSSFSPYPIRFFGWVLPRLWDASPPLKALMGTLHFGAGRLFMLAIALHLLAALWHALHRDGMVSRILPRWAG